MMNKDRIGISKVEFAMPLFRKAMLMKKDPQEEELITRIYDIELVRLTVNPLGGQNILMTNARGSIPKTKLDVTAWYTTKSILCKRAVTSFS